MTTNPSLPTTTTTEPDHQDLHTLTRAGKVSRSLLGMALFMSWLLLFVFGMSLRAKDFRICIFRTDTDSIDFHYLLLYGVTFTPTNVALLASLAGILGGFASNLTADNQFSHTKSKKLDPKSEEFSSYVYMTENPLVSMLRGFITYLIFIAGSYLTNFTTQVDPKDSADFLGLTASSYFKFAVTVSLLAYLAGYDPSRMKALVNSVSMLRKDPPPPTQETVVTHKTTESLKFETTGAQLSANGQADKPA